MVLIFENKFIFHSGIENDLNYTRVCFMVNMMHYLRQRAYEFYSVFNLKMAFAGCMG